MTVELSCYLEKSIDGRELRHCNFCIFLSHVLMGRGNPVSYSEFSAYFHCLICSGKVLLHIGLILRWPLPLKDPVFVQVSRT